MGIFDFFRKKVEEPDSKELYHSTSMDIESSLDKDYYSMFFQEQRPKKQLHSVISFTKLDQDVKSPWMQEIAACVECYQSRDFASALKHAETAIAQNKNNGYIYKLRASIKEDSGDKEGAISDFQKCLYIQGDDYTCYHSIGVNYLNLNKFDKAIKAFDIAIEIKGNLLYSEDVFPNTADGGVVLKVSWAPMYANRANAKISLSDYSGALSDLNRCIAKDPDYANGYNLLGILYIKQNKVEEAKKYLTIASSKGHAVATQLLASLLREDLGTSSSPLNDKYAKMVDSTLFNPFNITTDINRNKNLQFGNLTSVFKSELEGLFAKIGDSLTPEFFEQMTCGYTFNLIESYYNNAGFVPKVIMDKIIEQVYAAAKSSNKGYYLNGYSLDDFKYKMYYDLTHN